MIKENNNKPLKFKKRMKKTYQTPATDIVRIEAQPMLQDSMNVHSDKTISNSNDILSRGGSAWDDEEDY